MSVSINEDEIGVVEKKSPLPTNNLWTGRNRLFLNFTCKNLMKSEVNNNFMRTGSHQIFL